MHITEIVELIIIVYREIKYISCDKAILLIADTYVVEFFFNDLPPRATGPGGGSGAATLRRESPSFVLLFIIKIGQQISMIMLDSTRILFTLPQEH